MILCARSVSLVTMGWLAVALPSEAPAQEYIRLASFNIAEFGEGNHAETRDLPAIAGMLVTSDLDLVAIEEVGVQAGGDAQVAALTAAMNTLTPAGDPDYFFIVSPPSGDERCAVIFRDPVVYDDDISWLDEDKDPDNPRLGGRTFYRIPPALPFHAGTFDFIIVPVHFMWTRLEVRKKEMKKVRDFLRSGDSTENDWIVLGDMNRYGLYQQTDKKAFDQLLDGNWRTHYRFPLLEAVTDPDDMKVWKASRDEYSTTVAESRDLYDQFIVTRGVFAELGTEEPEFGVDVGIVAFDMAAPYSTMSHNEVKYTISDHRPVWMRLRTDLGDDD